MDSAPVAQFLGAIDRQPGITAITAESRQKGEPAIMSTRDTNDDGYCVIYALPGDSDLMVFNADLSEGGHMAGADPDDLTAVAIVELESEVNLELWGDVPRACYPEMDSDCLSTGCRRFSARQVMAGDAGGSVNVIHGSYLRELLE